MTLKNVDSLLRVSETSPLGTLGFVLDEETLLVRVSGGWQYVAVIFQMHFIEAYF